MTKYKLRKFFKPVYPILWMFYFLPFTFLASVLLFAIRKMRIANMPLSKWIFKKVGVFPITNHYYEPLFDDSLLKLPLRPGQISSGYQLE